MSPYLSHCDCWVPEMKLSDVRDGKIWIPSRASKDQVQCLQQLATLVCQQRQRFHTRVLSDEKVAFSVSKTLGYIRKRSVRSANRNHSDFTSSVPPWSWLAPGGRTLLWSTWYMAAELHIKYTPTHMKTHTYAHKRTQICTQTNTHTNIHTMSEYKRKRKSRKIKALA